MRFANIDERACIAIGAQYFDIAEASRGRFSGDVQATYASWPDLIDWYASDFDPRVSPRSRGDWARRRPRLHKRSVSA